MDLTMIIKLGVANLKEIYGIDFKKEFKVYKCACKGKGEYGTYTKWKKHILELISNTKPNDLENLKHLCMFREKGEHHSLTIFMALIAIIVPNYISDVWQDDHLFSIIAYGLLAGFVTVILTYDYANFIMSEEFYHDLAEIVQSEMDAVSGKKKLLIETKKDNCEV